MNLRMIYEANEKNEIIYDDVDPDKKLPDLIERKVLRKIADFAKDYSMEFKNSVDLVDKTLEELNIKRPLINTPRWPQYLNMIATGVKELQSARGENFEDLEN